MRVKTVECGAATTVYAATAPELEGCGGVYLSDCRICEVDDRDENLDAVRSYAVNPEAAERLWAVSEEMIGQSVPL